MAGPLERPSYGSGDLSDYLGKVVALWVEQEGGRDAVHFRLLNLPGVGLGACDFVYYLDEGTTVALTQLQLLRDALALDLWVRVHYSEDPDYSTDITRWVYYVRVAREYEHLN